MIGFAPDDVHLRFSGPEGPRLSARHVPRVERGGARHDAGDPGYRDALCESVGATLLEGYVTATSIVLRLDDGTTLTFSLHDETHGESPEVAELVGPDGLWLFGPEFDGADAS